MVESWIVEDTQKDKSALYGYELPVGTWFGTYKVNDDELWSEYVESGVLKGFSIEGNFTQTEVELHTHQELSQEDRDILEVYLLLTYTPADLDKYYVWKLGPADANHQHCPKCIENNNKLIQFKLSSKKRSPKGEDRGYR